jgi:hypothetical protein
MNSLVKDSRAGAEMLRRAMVRERLAAVAAALLLAAPRVHASEPSIPATPAETSSTTTAEAEGSFSDRFFRGTSPGELPTEKLALVAGLYVAAATSVGIGVATLVGAGSKSDEAETFKGNQPQGFCNDLAAPSCASYRRLLADERSRRETGFLLLGLGGLFALGGGVTAELWHNDDAPNVALTLGARGISLGVRGSF